jgi:HprK-related kinase A
LSRLSELSTDAVATVLRDAGLSLDFGAARARVHSDVDGLAAAIRDVYGEFAHEPDVAFHDVTVNVRRCGGVHGLLRPRIELCADAEVPFEPFPPATHLPLLEWGMNYLLAQRLNHRLLLHAGVVEIAGRGIVMAALPGAGKSTLTAALALSGFRLLSDEFGVVGLDDGLLHPLLRPAALKNDAIDVIVRHAPRARLGPRFTGTRKGTVAHLAPDAASCRGRAVPVPPAVLLFPRFTAGAALSVEPMTKARAFVKLAANSFNYEILGPDAFDAVGALVRRCTAARMTYGDLPAAIAAIRTLAAGDGVG